MEDTLRGVKFSIYGTCSKEVLILVLMEDTLRDKVMNAMNNFTVLILVLMEDTLRVIKIKNKMEKFSGLNPCFNGRYSQSY